MEINKTLDLDKLRESCKEEIIENNDGTITISANDLRANAANLFGDNIFKDVASSEDTPA